MASFLNRISALLSDSAPKSDSTDLQLAVGALLVEAAMRDDVFAPEERAAIERVLAERFSLSSQDARELLDRSQKANAQSLQLFGFTNKVVKQMDEAERIKVIEMLWEVAYADGVLDPHEDTLIRRVAGLIYVSDYERGAARRRVRERMRLESS